MRFQKGYEDLSQKKKTPFLIAFKSTYRRNRLHGLTSCARRVKSTLFKFAFPYIGLGFQEVPACPKGIVLLERWNLFLARLKSSNQDKSLS